MNCPEFPERVFVAWKSRSLTEVNLNVPFELEAFEGIHRFYNAQEVAEYALVRKAVVKVTKELV